MSKRQRLSTFACPLLAISILATTGCTSKGCTFSSVQKLNDNSAILAHGQNSTTGQSGSVVLTPLG